VIFSSILRPPSLVLSSSAILSVTFLAHAQAPGSVRTRRAWLRYLGVAPDGDYAEDIRQQLVEAER